VLAEITAGLLKKSRTRFWFYAVVVVVVPASPFLLMLKTCL
jgi:hypothetical protein